MARDGGRSPHRRGTAFTVTGPPPRRGKFPASIGPDGGIGVRWEDTEKCVRATAAVTLRGARTEQSPAWLADKLRAIGMHPINSVVDITNYILHAIGPAPLHAFDAATLTGGIVVKRAEQGAKFVTLDGVERTLDAADLMICDEREPRCMAAGVFGGLNSGSSFATTDIFLESACFNATSVRRTARRHGISTDSSFRFERGVDPNGCMYALKLAAILIRELTGAEIEGPVVDIYPTPWRPTP